MIHTSENESTVMRKGFSFHLGIHLGATSSLLYNQTEVNLYNNTLLSPGIFHCPNFYRITRDMYNIYNIWE